MSLNYFLLKSIVGKYNLYKKDLFVIDQLIILNLLYLLNKKNSFYLGCKTFFFEQAKMEYIISQKVCKGEPPTKKHSYRSSAIKSNPKENTTKQATKEHSYKVKSDATSHCNCRRK